MAKTEVAPKPEAVPATPDVAPQRDLVPAEPEAALPSGLVEATPLSVVDEFHGHGGSYLLDPATGIRTLIERTEPASI